MNIGINTLRAGLRLTIHRGGVGNRPNRLSASAPVAADEVILSGMVMTQVRNTTKGRNEWVKGIQSDSVGPISQPYNYYLAVDDSADYDVQASGSLQGLSVRGDYEISTSQFVTGSYVAGDPLTPGTGANAGLVEKATAGDLVIGHVVKDYDGPVNLGATFTDALPDPATTVSTGVQGGVYTRPRETNAVDLQRLRFETVPPYILP